MSTGEAIWGGLVTLAVTVALIVPMTWSPEEDSFPLSPYRMFATSRGQPTFHRMVAKFEDGTSTHVGPELLGTHEVLQAMAWLDEVARQPKRRAQLCAKVALALARSSGSPRPRSLELQRVRFDPVDYFVRGPVPLQARVLERCAVPDVGAAPPEREMAP